MSVSAILGRICRQLTVNSGHHTTYTFYAVQAKVSFRRCVRLLYIFIKHMVESLCVSKGQCHRTFFNWFWIPKFEHFPKNSQINGSFVPSQRYLLVAVVSLSHDSMKKPVVLQNQKVLPSGVMLTGKSDLSALSLLLDWLWFSDIIDNAGRETIADNSANLREILKNANLRNWEQIHEWI
jgi:hypothetical protein